MGESKRREGPSASSSPSGSRQLSGEDDFVVLADHIPRPRLEMGLSRSATRSVGCLRSHGTHHSKRRDAQGPAAAGRRRSAVREQASYMRTTRYPGWARNQVDLSHCRRHGCRPATAGAKTPIKFPACLNIGSSSATRRAKIEGEITPILPYRYKDSSESSTSTPGSGHHRCGTATEQIRPLQPSDRTSQPDSPPIGRPG
jgi:hypothetical protein